MSISLTFLGAAGTVTGSKYLVQVGGKNILIDAGMFQGERTWRERNWEDFHIDPKSIDLVLITHAHIDHTGILPRLLKFGLKCPVYATETTEKLSNLLLPDTAHLQEEEAEYRGKRGKSRHTPPQPLYTGQDAAQALSLFKSVQFNQTVNLLPDISASWHRAGHILGAASICLSINKTRITFSGDIGRYGVPILKDPETCQLGELLLIESTYGDRLHDEEPVQNKLAAIISSTTTRGGVVVIPSFAVGRCQLLLYYIRELKEKKLIPDIPVIVDSPMADDATVLYKQAIGEYDDEALGIVKRGAHPFSFSKLYFTKDRDDSIKLNSINEPMIIISASGMLSGGRILHHLRNRISQPANTILFVGYQPPGGRGAWIQSGADTLRIFGEEIPIRAQIAEISALSAHGDKADLLRWCKEAQSKGSKPSRVAVVHGEPSSANSFSNTLKSSMGWDSFVAQYKQEIKI